MSLQKKFTKAAQYLQTLTEDLNPPELLKFYALYKQATVGSCDISKPNWYQMYARQKWEAWKNLNGMSCEDAMQNYIEEIAKFNPNWEDDVTSDSGSWVATSHLINMDEKINDGDKTFLDWVKEGQEDRVQELLNKKPELLNLTDTEGLLPIHWAADRGHLGILQLLIKNGSDLNSQDEDGQTALHYAASCGHVDVVKYLLSIGAQSIKDNDGLTPKDIADEHLKGIL